MPQADEGEVRSPRNCRSARASSAPQDVALRARVADAGDGAGDDRTSSARRAAADSAAAAANRTNITVRLVPKDERKRSSEQIARDLSRQLAGVIPGVDHHHPRLGRKPADERLMRRRRQPVCRSRFAATICRRRTLGEAAKNVMDKVPEVRNARVGRDEGRPELAMQVDRPKAALLGLSVTNVAESIRTSVGGARPRSSVSGQRVSDRRQAARRGPAARRETSTTS